MLRDVLTYCEIVKLKKKLAKVKKFAIELKESGWNNGICGYMGMQCDGKDCTECYSEYLMKILKEGD